MRRDACGGVGHGCVRRLDFHSLFRAHSRQCDLLTRHQHGRRLLGDYVLMVHQYACARLRSPIARPPPARRLRLDGAPVCVYAAPQSNCTAAAC